MTLQKHFIQKAMLVLFSLSIFSIDVIFARNIRDEEGRTELMNYVISTQYEMAIIEKDIASLWHKCYETVTVQHGGYRHQYTRIEVRRKASCLDKDIEAHNQREIDLKNFKNSAFNNIRLLVQESNPNDLSAFDHQGMTVLNHCTHRAIYNILRESGVPFQYDAFTYTYRGELIISSIILTVVTIALYKNGYLSYEAFVQLGKNIESGAINTLEGIKNFVYDPLNKSMDAMNACIDGIYNATVFIYRNSRVIFDISLEILCN